MTLTLEQLHKDLDVKQNINIYVRNTNRKYGTNYTATQELDREIYMLIKFNTLGKLRRHGQQSKFIHSYIKLEKDKKRLGELLQDSEVQLEKAREIVDKDNLKDAYVETLKMATKFYGNFGINEEVIAFLEKNGVRYAKHLSAKGVAEFFKDRIDWFEEVLK